MELEKDTLGNLIEYLKKHGYPADGFAVDYRIGGFVADLAVIDPVLRIPVILFEVKSQRTEPIKKTGIGQLMKPRGKYTDIPLYLVYPKRQEPFFEVERIYPGGSRVLSDKSGITRVNEKIDHNNLNYASQRNARKWELAARNREKAKRTIDVFQIACWALAAAVLAAEVLHKLSVITLDAADITIFGLIIALVVIPFAGILKILGVEYERLNKP